jgi:hypothetical protein
LYFTKHKRQIYTQAKTSKLSLFAHMRLWGQLNIAPTSRTIWFFDHNFRKNIDSSEHVFMWHYLSDAIGALFKMIFEEIFPLNLPKFDKIWLFSSKFIISFPQKTGKIRWAWYSKRFMRKFFLVMHYIYLIILNIQNLYLFKNFKKIINRWIINYKLKFCLKFV